MITYRKKQAPSNWAFAFFVNNEAEGINARLAYRAKRRRLWNIKKTNYGHPSLFLY